MAELCDTERDANIDTTETRGRSHYAMPWVSDNESDEEADRTSRSFLRNSRAWRDGRVGAAMSYLRREAKTLRNQKSRGNVLHRHVDREVIAEPALPERHGKGWVRGAPRGGPINFYDRAWYDRLSQCDKDALRVREPYDWDVLGIFG
jgi:hypothetical protein